MPRVAGPNAPERQRHRELREAAGAPTADPLRRSEDYLMECGTGLGELRRIRAEIAADVEAAAARALARRDGKNV
ncbi:MAG TPA: hypothetical protein VNH11_03240 [Pirellulales bacterium]|nr:hypothetical protein [Pirellulales bacterium]